MCAPTLDLVAGRRAFVAAQRAALSDTFAERGPDQPTLCDGWRTRDLLQHLVLREAGPVRRLLAGAAARGREAGWTELIGQFRAGPPPGSPFRLPGADAAANLEEFFVHHEDVRRATPGWTRRELPIEVEDAIWRRLSSPLGRVAVRRTDVGVGIQRVGTRAADGAFADGERATLRAVRPGVIITGLPSEILMFLFGRQAAADVDLHGPALARDRLAHAALGF
jgi:uncharacterized protein (TIGR03085 family)